jgi:hypothetical protein
MDFGVHKDVIVEHNSLQVDKENVWHFIQHVSLGRIRSSLAGLTQTIANQLSRMHSL